MNDLTEAAQEEKRRSDLENFVERRKALNQQREFQQQQSKVAIHFPHYLCLQY